MIKIKLIILFIGLSLQKQASWNSKLLANADELKAVCSDGSPPRYFKSFSSSDSKLWIVYLLGGAGCSNEEMCRDRLNNKSYFTSSKGFTGEFSNSQGIFERDCNINPHFCEANYVLLSYCSSDWWTGDNTYHFQDSKEPALIHFRGFNIVQSILAELLQDTPLINAQKFVLAGTSAGGVGVMNLADRVHALLKLKIKSLQKFMAIIDSALFLGNPVFKPLPCSDTFYCSVERTYRDGVKIWKSILDDDCQSALKEEAWRCNMVDPGVGFVDAPAMILSQKYDLWQWMSDGGSKDLASMMHLAGRGVVVEQVVNKLLAEKKVEYAVVSSCFFHTFLHYKEQFLELKIKGKKVQDAVHQFIEGKTGSLINECQGIGCNEQCSQVKDYVAKDLSSAPDYGVKSAKE